MKPEEMSMFPVGEPNDAYAKYFVGQSYLNMLSSEQVVVGNITFEPGCRNNWHIHHADKGGGQMLLVTAGEGWYQEWGQKPAKTASRQCGTHSNRRKTLAWCHSEFLVPALGN